MSSHKDAHDDTRNAPKVFFAALPHNAPHELAKDTIDLDNFSLLWPRVSWERRRFSQDLFNR